MSSSSRTQATSPLGNPLPLHRPSTGTGTSASGLRTDVEAGRSEQSGLLEKEGMQGSTQPSRPLEPQKRLWYRLRGKDRKWVTWSESLKAIAFSSFLNAFLIFLPFAWAAHFAKGWQGNHGAVFALCFLTIMPLERLFDWGGEQLAMYLGDDLGDLVVITLNNAVEATLAIILLRRCELKLLQSTIVGVILLHLLLIPGTGFLVGGARIMHQHLNPHEAGLNQTLLIIGVMSLVIPTAFFQSLNRSAEVSAAVPNTQVISDEFRHRFLQMARGSSVILLIVYIGTRIYLHNPPGEGNALKPTPDAPREEIEKDAELEEAQPRVNPWACLILLVISVSLMAVTAEFLVESIEFVREESSIEEEWFGLFLLPLVSFSADGAVSIVYFVRSQLRGVLGDPPPIETLAEDKAIDLSVQFALFWTPFVVLLGWWSDRPMSMLFDLFEVTCLVAACFMVNYVTADSKTNWAEGLILIAFYAMIALSAWFYTGQPEIRVMSVCLESVAVALERGVGAEE